MGIDVRMTTDNRRRDLVVIDHNRLQAQRADLVNHPAAEISEYHQVKTLVGNLLQSSLVELAKEEGFIFNVLPLQSGADDARCTKPVSIDMRHHKKAPELSDLIGRLPAQLQELRKLSRTLLGVSHVQHNLAAVNYKALARSETYFQSPCATAARF
jgi:hypothetical protein